MALGQKNEKKWPGGTRKSVEKVTRKRYPKAWQKVNAKNHDFLEFAMKFHDSIVIYRSEWAWGADSIVFSNEFSRPERPENDGQCG